jgi:hypothetical protein
MTSFKGDAQLAKTGQPRVGTFQRQVLKSVLFAALGSAARSACGNISSSQMLIAGRVVVAFVVREFLGLPPSPGQNLHRVNRVLASHGGERRRDTHRVHCDTTLTAQLASAGRIQLCLVSPAGSERSPRRHPRAPVNLVVFLQTLEQRKMYALSRNISRRSRSKNKMSCNTAGPFTRGWRPFCEGGSLVNKSTNDIHSSSLSRCRGISHQTRHHLKTTGFWSWV